MIRPPTPSDQAYIAATWSRSVLSTHAHQRHMSSRTSLQLGKQIDAVLDRPDTRGLICARESDPDRILGWIVYVHGPATPVVHYVYVRREERQRGIAGALLSKIGVRPDSGVVCTSTGPSSMTLRRRYPAAVYLPLVEFLQP